jgi:hypothetical protein
MKRHIRCTVIFLVLSLTWCGNSKHQGTSALGKDQKSAERMRGSATPLPQPTVLMPTYEVLDRRTYDVPINTQIELHAVVSGKLTELGLKQLLQKLYDEANGTRGFKYHEGKPTNVFIYLYTSRDHYKSGMGQWIAMLSKGGEGVPIDTEIRTDLIAELDKAPEVKQGLPESKRMEIFRAIVAAEDRADADAQRMYPVPDPGKPNYSQAKASEQLMKQAKALNTLMEKYKAEVAKRYGITEEQLRGIKVEALEKNWPMPGMPNKELH